MNIIVLIKPVPEKYVNNNSANEENLVINPYDLYALSNIVELKSLPKLYSKFTQFALWFYFIANFNALFIYCGKF